MTAKDCLFLQHSMEMRMLCRATAQARFPNTLPTLQPPILPAFSTPHPCGVCSFPATPDPAYARAYSNKEEDQVSSFVTCPPLQATVWQRQEEPVKALRCAAMNALENARP